MEPHRILVHNSNFMIPTREKAKELIEEAALLAFYGLMLFFTFIAIFCSGWIFFGALNKGLCIFPFLPLLIQMCFLPYRKNMIYNTLIANPSKFASVWECKRCKKICIDDHTVNGANHYRKYDSEQHPTKKEQEFCEAIDKLAMAIRGKSKIRLDDTELFLSLIHLASQDVEKGIISVNDALVAVNHSTKSPVSVECSINLVNEEIRKRQIQIDL